MITTNQEDYLRAIFCLNEEGAEKLKSVNIAKFLNVSKPAVSEMLRKLKKEKYLEMTPYSNITLTYKGFKEAKKITFKHRVAETFLKEILQIEEKSIHKEAHKLEHSISDKVAKKMATLLKNPEYCPCGHKIPNIK